MTQVGSYNPIMHLAKSLPVDPVGGYLLTPVQTIIRDGRERYEREIPDAMIILYKRWGLYGDAPIWLDLILAHLNRIQLPPRTALFSDNFRLFETDFNEFCWCRWCDEPKSILVTSTTRHRRTAQHKRAVMAAITIEWSPFSRLCNDVQGHILTFLLPQPIKRKIKVDHPQQQQPSEKRHRVE